MLRKCMGRLAAAAVLLMMPVVANAVPAISSITPSKGPANTGASVTVFCSDCGYGTDRVYFPGTNNWVNPFAWSLNNWVAVRVPATWSGNVQLQKQGAGTLSAPVNHDISFNWSGQEWFSWPFTWFLNNNAAPGCTFNDTRNALIAGYNAWSCASGISMTFGGGTGIAVTSNDGTNCRYWRNSGWSPGTIAVATWYYIIATNEIVESDIAFNSQHFTWSCAGAAGSMDVGNIGTHEEGHTIGLLDMYGAADFDKTMYGFGANGEIIRRTLHTDDALGAEFMYPHARANFVAATLPGWSGPLVPRNTPDATSTFAPLPATLNGNATGYYNAGVTNNGADCAAPSGENQLYVDDAPSWIPNWSGTWNPAVTIGWINLATLFRGGRHTLKQFVDRNFEHLESSEGDNTTQLQYVWSPLVLANSSPVSRSAPPLNGPFAADNCDGMQYTTTGFWGGFGIIPTTNGDDYDIRLFGDYANSTTGFSTTLDGSAYAGTSSDFVIWNRNVAGPPATLWAGIIRYEPGTSSFGNVMVEATEEIADLHPGTVYGTTASQSSTLSNNQVLKIIEVFLGSTTTTYNFRLDNTSGTADLNISLYDTGTDYLHKSEYLAASQVIGPGTDESFNYQPSTGGHYALVVWKRSNADLGKTNNFTVYVGPALTDLVSTDVPAGWSSPAVPRNTNGATPASAVLTATLDGNANTTYYNWNIHQFAPNPTPTSQTRHYLDEEPGAPYWFSNIPDGSSGTTYWYWVNAGPNTVRGGRHTIAAYADYGAVVAETNEGNNMWSGQYVWSPLTLIKDTPVVRLVPPDWGTGIYPNSDGMRFSQGSLQAWVHGVAPYSTLDDYDLYVYDNYASSTSGFSNLRKGSFQGGNRTDFVVGHFSGQPNPTFPAVVRFNAGVGGNFTKDQSDDVGHFSPPPADYLGEVLGPNRLVDVYEMFLPVGETANIILHRTAGTDDIAFEVFPSTGGGIYARGEGDPSFAYSADTDTAEYTSSANGWHPIVVYRTDGTSAGTSVTYNIHWDIGITVDVPGEQAAYDLRFYGSLPNPVRDGSRMTFSLAEPGRVRLELFDLSGRRVRSLADGYFEAGPHQAVWDRRLEDGSRAPAGIYWARLEASGRTFTHRVAVLD